MFLENAPSIEKVKSSAWEDWKWKNKIYEYNLNLKQIENESKAVLFEYTIFIKLLLYASIHL